MQSLQMKRNKFLHCLKLLVGTLQILKTGPGDFEVQPGNLQGLSFRKTAAHVDYS